MDLVDLIPSGLRRKVPGWLSGAFSNTGGTNFLRTRFAGNLLRGDLSEKEYLRICHALILANGVRKTTDARRNTAILERHLADGLIMARDGMRVLDIGASLGVDAKDTYGLLGRSARVERYDIGDLYTKLLYDRERGLVYDEDHRLIQVLRPLSFVSIHFAFNFPYERFFTLPKRLRTMWLSRRHRFSPERPMVDIPLVHPSLAVNTPGSPFHLRRLDVFQPIGDPKTDRYRLIICMHLLLPRYFSPEQIERGVDNLTRHLEVGGSLLVGATDSYRVVQRKSEGELVVRRFP
jgi:hypothetical protein